jgi:hypothetical protein
MRSNQLITGVLAVVATTGLIGLGGAAEAGEPTTTRERGVVIECSGTTHGRSVFASLYENNPYGNEIQILVGDDEDQVGGSRRDEDGFVNGRSVSATMKVDGRRATITGTARKVGKVVPVHDEYDDAGQHITAEGTHRRLDTGLRLTWSGRTVPLECGTAFAYDLTVTKESTV